MPAAVLFCAALICLLPEGSVAFKIDTKLNLPEPTTIIAPSRPGTPSPSSTLPHIDSSLSPKIIKAFYEIHFVPTVDNQLAPNMKDGNQLVLTLPGRQCPYNAFSSICKFYYSTSKVTTVQQVDDIIGNANRDGDVPVIDGLVSPAEATKIVHKYEESISKKVNPKAPVSDQGDRSVPVYRGTIDTQSVLRRPEQFYPCSRRACSWPPTPYS